MLKKSATMLSFILKTESLLPAFPISEPNHFSLDGIVLYMVDAAKT